MAARRYTKKKKLSKEFPYRPIRDHITWFDAQSETGWLSKEQWKSLDLLCLKLKVGFIKKQMITLPLGTDEDENDNIIEFGEVLCIPKNWI